MNHKCNGYTADRRVWREVTAEGLHVGMTIINAGGQRWDISRLDPSPAGPLPVMTVVWHGSNHTESWDCNLRPYSKYIEEAPRGEGS